MVRKSADASGLVGELVTRNNLFIREALAHTDVAFEEVDDYLWTVRFANVAPLDPTVVTNVLIRLPR